MAFMLTFNHKDEKPDDTMLLIQFFLSTIVLPIKDLLISISFSYLYFYQASNLKRKTNKKKDNKNHYNNNTGRASVVKEEGEDHNTNRMSIDTDGVNKLLTYEQDPGDKYANNKSEIIQSMIKAE